MTQENTSTMPEPEKVAPETPPVEAAGDYESGNVQILRDAAHIRRRPGAYIGDTSTNGLHHLVYELVYNSVDEALAGFCKNIHIRIHVNGSLSVTDDGRGIPVEIHPETGRPTLEVVLTTVGAGAKFDKRTYKTSAGLHGMGAKAVTALSEWTEAEVRRNGLVYVQEYERGKPTTEVKEIGAAGNRTGTRVTFKPDPEIFKDVTFNYDTLESRLRELAFLNKGLLIKLSDEASGREQVFDYQGGIAEFVEYLNRSEDVLHKPPIYVEKVADEVRVEVALQYTTTDEERVRCYTNNAYNPVGGTHLSGFRNAITRTLNAYGTKEGLFKKVQPTGEDCRRGLTAVVSVQVPEPQFESNNKLRLNNPEVEGIVTSIVNEQLAKYLEEHPKEGQRIARKVELEAEAREAAAKAKKDLKDRKSILSGGGLPGKLMDCTSRDAESSELFLVEGDSAGGSAESGRDRKFQAILPLRGKPLNVEKAAEQKLLSNEEIRCIISAVGIDIGNSEDLAKLRYGKIVILTDADVDGQHIRTLLLTFFYRQMQKLVADGHVFVARPPLFKVTQKKDVRYIQTASEMNTELMQRGLKGTRLTILPRAGSSEAQMTLEGERLVQLVRVTSELEDALQTLERRGLNLTEFLKKPGDSRPMYYVKFGSQERWCWSWQEVQDYRQEVQQQQGHEVVVVDELGRVSGNGHANGDAQSLTFQVNNFQHEVCGTRGVNRGLERLREFNLGAADLLPPERLAGREPDLRFVLEHGDARKVLPHLRDLVSEVRKFGERGITITRFKGLGEMDGEELWETTLDPSKRTLLRVQLDDALKADELFRDLMGEKVEPRRNFIYKHALEVKDIDYHGA